MLVRQVFTSLFAAAALAGCLYADPIPVATSATITYAFISTVYVNETFSFAGPDLNLSGTSFDFSGGFPNNLMPGVPFAVNTFLMYSGEGGKISGTISGMTVSLFPTGPARLTASPAVFNLPGGVVPPPFSLDIPPITVPAIAAGTVTMCDCQFRPPTIQLPFTMDIPGAMAIQIINDGTIDRPLYLISSIQFTTVPEPNTAVPAVLTIAVSACSVRRRTRRPY